MFGVSGHGIHGEKHAEKQRERDDAEEKRNDPGGGFGEPVM